MDQQAWSAFSKWCCDTPSVGVCLDVSRMGLTDRDIETFKPGIDDALAAMRSLEGGAIANPDEDRMVGHYWLRDPERAPTPEIRTQITKTLADIDSFTRRVHSGELRGASGPFRRVLSIGIGGSALGPMFVSDALGDDNNDKVRIHFIDNTDPDGIARTLRQLDGELGQTLCLVISKSGGTPETRNGMLEVKAAYQRAGLDFAKHAVAITGQGSKLDNTAAEQGWIARFPMWDWVGGRTSQLSAVGLLPAALQGLDIAALLDGAKRMDHATRNVEAIDNPAALLAIAWHKATNGKGEKDMVVLPYKDRLILLSRYLQQLIMESLGKRLNLQGQVVEQGISVYGNKGSTDQHAYVQQLRDGVNNFFALFVRVLDPGAPSVEVEPGVNSADYLHGFWCGTRAALADNARTSITLTLDRVDPTSIGAVIALFERAVGIYAELVGINAYHQPGVEAGKKAAADVLELQNRVRGALDSDPRTADLIARSIDAEPHTETVFFVLEHLAASGRATREGRGPASVFSAV